MWIDGIATAGALVVCAFLLLSARQTLRQVRSPLPVPGSPISIKGAVLRGDPTAPVVLVEWADYECPYCSRTERELIPKLNATYIQTGKVELAFFHHPVPTLHPHSEKAAEAAACAGRQGMFWQMHLAIFADQAHLETTALLERALAIGLDMNRFMKCLNRGDTATEVRAGAQIGESADPMGVPTFMVGLPQPDGRVKVETVLRKMQPYRQFARAIDSLLQRAKPDLSRGLR